MLFTIVNLVIKPVHWTIVALTILLACRMSAGQDNKKSIVEKHKALAAKKEQEAFVAWGKEVDGLQPGIRLTAVEIYAAESLGEDGTSQHLAARQRPHIRCHNP